MSTQNSHRWVATSAIQITLSYFGTLRLERPCQRYISHHRQFRTSILRYTTRWAAAAAVAVVGRDQLRFLVENFDLAFAGVEQLSKNLLCALLSLRLRHHGDRRSICIGWPGCPRSPNYVKKAVSSSPPPPSLHFVSALSAPVEQVSCRLAVSRSLGDRQFKGQGGQPPDSDIPPPPDMKGQLVSPEPSVNSVQLEPHDRVIIVASGKEGMQSCLACHLTRCSKPRGCHLYA